MFAGTGAARDGRALVMKKTSSPPRRPRGRWGGHNTDELRTDRRAPLTGPGASLRRQRVPPTATPRVGQKVRAPERVPPRATPRVGQKVRAPERAQQRAPERAQPTGSGATSASRPGACCCSRCRSLDRSRMRCASHQPRAVLFSTPTARRGAPPPLVSPNARASAVGVPPDVDWPRGCVAASRGGATSARTRAEETSGGGATGRGLTTQESPATSAWEFRPGEHCRHNYALIHAPVGGGVTLSC